MTYTHIAKLPSHAIFSSHDIVELMIQEYLSLIEEPMISEDMTHKEINFVHLTLMNSNSLFQQLAQHPDLNIEFLQDYTDDFELNQAIFETVALIKQLQQHEPHLEKAVIIKPIDFEDHIRNETLSITPMSIELQQDVDWQAVAERNRPAYTEINLNYPAIGFQGNWLIKKQLVS